MTADEWNARYPVGTVVVYHPRGLDHPGCREARTASLAWPNLRDVPLVRLVGKPTGVPLAKLRPLATAGDRERT